MHFGNGNELEKLEMAMEAAGMAWWWMEIPTGAVFFSPNKASMIDRKPSDFLHYKDFTKLVHHEDYDQMMQDMTDHLEGRKDIYRAIYRIKAKDGTYKVFLDRGKIVAKDKQGNIALAGIVIDISDVPDEIKKII